MTRESKMRDRLVCTSRFSGECPPRHWPSAALRDGAARRVASRPESRAGERR